jgi:hypothetical protein
MGNHVDDPIFVTGPKGGLVAMAPEDLPLSYKIPVGGFKASQMIAILQKNTLERICYFYLLI